MRSCSVFLREPGTGLKRFQGRPFRRRLVSAVPPDTLSCTGIPASFLCPYRMAACLRDGESPHACESLWSLSFFPASAVRPFSVRRTGNGADFRTVMGRVGGGGASRPHRGVSAALFGAERLRLLDLPQWGRAGRNFRLMRMQLMCIIGKNTRYGGGRTQRMKPVAR